MKKPAHKKPVPPSKKPFRCEFCDKTFTTKPKKEAHIRTHSKDGKFNCPTPGCKITCKTYFKMKLHIQTHLPKEERTRYPCTQCSKSYSRAYELQGHSRMHTEQAFVCSENGCEKQFPTNSTLRRHSRSHSDNRPFSCTQCDGKFKSKATLKQHIFAQHQVDQWPWIYKCPTCSQGFKTKNNMQTHQKTHTAVKHRKKFQCDKCTAKYCRKSALIQHKKVKHSGVLKTFPCTKPSCKAVLISATGLAGHLKEVHGPKEKIWKCVRCLKGFQRKSTLKRHLNIHFRQNNFVCQFCGEGFYSLWKLRKHQRLNHIPRKKVHPVKCYFCGDSYRYLSRHMIKHTMEMLFKCDVCQKRSKSVQKLQAHMDKAHGRKIHYK